MSKSPLKIAIACSPGGHMIQARKLALIYGKYDYFYFTFKGTVADSLKYDNKVIAIGNITRSNPLSWFTGFFSSLYYALKERPDAVITTGAGVVVFFCLFSKLFGAKIIFIESMAKINKPTLTAKMLYPFSDLFIVQWPQLQKFFAKAQYLGRLL
jgi:beta-1,4-N-acetylglucosaminyltransferase